MFWGYFYDKETDQINSFFCLKHWQIPRWWFEYYKFLFSHYVYGLIIVFLFIFQNNILSFKNHFLRHFLESVIYNLSFLFCIAIVRLHTSLAPPWSIAQPVEIYPYTLNMLLLEEWPRNSCHDKMDLPLFKNEK